MAPRASAKTRTPAKAAKPKNAFEAAKDAAAKVDAAGAVYREAGGTAPTEAAAPTPQPAAIKRPTEDEFREAHYRRLMGQHREHDRRIATIDLTRKGIVKERTRVRTSLKQSGYFLENVDNILKSEAVTEGRSKEQQKVDQLAEMRAWEGLPNPRSGEQLDLELRMPDTEREAKVWEEDGYHHGLIGSPCELPAGCPAIFHQRWMDFWHRGDEYRERLEGLADVNPAAFEPPAPAAEAEQIDLDAEAKRLAKSDFMTRSDPGDAFDEADESELAAQTPRRAVQDAREGDTVIDLDPDITDDKIDSAFNGDFDDDVGAAELVH
jgi:hypothetical protein